MGNRSWTNQLLALNTQCAQLENPFVTKRDVGLKNLDLLEIFKSQF